MSAGFFDAKFVPQVPKKYGIMTIEKEKGGYL